MSARPEPTLSNFDVHSPPFDRLSATEVTELLAKIDIGYFPPGDRLIERDKPSDTLFVIVKGKVAEREGDAVVGLLGPRDIFGARAVVHGAGAATFVTAEETLCHLIPRPVILSLIERNAAFASFFYAQISRKLDHFAISSQAGGGIASVLHARVAEAQRARAVFIDAGASIEQAGHLMREADTNALFVRDDGRVGVITGMNLSKALILHKVPLETPIRAFCHFDLVTVGAHDFIYEALIQMTRHSRRRLAVTSDGAFTGFLEDIDILGLLAGNSQLIPSRIDRARDVQDLALIAPEIQVQVKRLRHQGIKVEAINAIISDLNRRLFSKLFTLIAPPSIQEAGCLMLMGSEGRGEQAARTDQDNGLLLAAPVPEQDLIAFRTSFLAALDSFGFPRCPGDIMASNATWSQPVDSFIRQLRHWVEARTPEAAMDLSIFYDGIAVAGRKELLTAAKTAIIDMLRGEGALLAHLANLIETFHTPQLPRLARFWVTSPDQIDLKRAGTFPIVQGVRTLSMQHGIIAESTAARLDALAEAGALGRTMATDLQGALYVFMELRLRTQLAAIRRDELESESIIRTAELSTVDRDILGDALRITRRFRELIRTRFQLNAF